MLFSKKTATDSDSQLAVDFGYYPPKPLKPTKLKNNFDIVYVGRFARISYAVKLFCYFLTEKSIVDYPSFEGLQQGILKVRESKHAIVTQLNSSPYYLSWILLSVFLICFSPILILLVFVIFVFILIKFIRSRVFKGLGHFLPFPNWPPQVAIFPNAFVRGKYTDSEISIDGCKSRSNNPPQ